MPQSLSFPFVASTLICAVLPAAAVGAVKPAGAAQAEAATLRALATDAATREFYDRNGWRPVWSPAGVRALEQALSDRTRHGLDRLRFMVEAKSATGGPAMEIALTRVALRYAAALGRGVKDPASLHEVYTLPRPSPDLAGGLAHAISSGGLGVWLESLAPQDSEYRALSEAYLRYREEAAGQSSASAIAATGLIRVGDADSRVRAIAAQLADSGYLPAAGAGDVYTEAMVEAVKLLQHDYGIAADGVIGPNTLKVLNLGPAERARALAVALERRRWLSRTPPATRIDVNTAAAHLRYFREGELVDSRKVIVGTPGRETPALLAPIYRLVANPSWTVPRSIQNTELANVGDDYLGNRNMTMQDGWIVQQPGPGNALGLVKFDMQNDQAIYLHDTSSPELFDRSERHLSHGCVRVEDALGFAQLLAEDEGIGAAWGKVSLSSDTAFVPLPRKIPVRMLYHNVFLADDGQLAFRTDPYGWNDAVAQALGFGAAAVPRPRSGAIDVGP